MCAKLYGYPEKTVKIYEASIAKLIKNNSSRQLNDILKNIFKFVGDESIIKIEFIFRNAGKIDTRLHVRFNKYLKYKDSWFKDMQSSLFNHEYTFKSLLDKFQLVISHINMEQAIMSVAKETKQRGIFCRGCEDAVDIWTGVSIVSGSGGAKVLKCKRCGSINKIVYIGSTDIKSTDELIESISIRYEVENEDA